MEGFRNELNVYLGPLNHESNAYLGGGADPQTAFASENPGREGSPRVPPVRPRTLLELGLLEILETS